jgi:hypothetical protein
MARALESYAASVVRGPSGCARRGSCCRRAMAAACYLCITYGTTFAGADSGVEAGGVGHVNARVLEYIPSDPGELRADATVGALVRAGIGHPSFPTVYAAGLDYRLGAGLPASFILDANLLPVGVGVIAGQLGMLMVTTGVGVSGATGGLLQFSGQLPLESRLEFDLPGPLHGSLWLRASWLRAAGRQRAAFADDVVGGFALRVGREDRGRRVAYGSGFCIGTEYIDRAGTRAVGIVIGHELDGVFQP